MKVVVLGAAGKQGSGATGVLGRRDSISELVLADLNRERLDEVAASVPCETQTVQLDVSDEAAVAALLDEHASAAVVLSAVGPSFKFAESLMRLSIAAGIDYVDIQDDAEVVDRVADLDPNAAAAGVTMVSGAGLTPGLSNVLSKLAHTRFDRLDELRIFWVSNMTEAPTIANWGHRLGVWSQEVPVIEDGELVYRPGASAEQVVSWPQPAGDVTQQLCAHPEPLSLCRNLPDLGAASVWGGYTPIQHDVLLAELRDLGLTSFEQVELPGIGVLVPVEFMSGFAATEVFRSGARFQEVLEAEREIGDNNGLRVEATGLVDGKDGRAIYTFFSDDRNIGIYTTAAVTTYLVAEGRIDNRGVLFLEQLEPDLVLAEVRAQGIEIVEETSELSERA